MFEIFQTDLSVSGALDISVAFQVPKTLLVTVHGASNLAPRDVNGSADPFVKIAVPGCDKVFQTQVKPFLSRISNQVRHRKWLEALNFELRK